ncbi:MAG: rhodanese-like domain-containing protein [Planctomycetota bacterium]|jgi:thiosulfate/3-mercaptopyruvate sulfurtransferase
MKGEFKSQQIGRISTKELYARLSDPDLRLVDVRSVEAYNGWKLRGETRGGHIKSARSLPLKWADYIDWIEIVRSKEIMPCHCLVLYGYDSAESERVARQFIRAGYQDIQVYYDFMNEWNPNEELPMQRLPRYRNLVSARWLGGLIANGVAPEYHNSKYVICHAHYRNRDAYTEGHIPGAVEIDTCSLESPETWNRRSPEEIKNALESLGITSDTTVVLYGRYSNPDNSDPFPGSSAGQLGAIRCAFIMMYAGVGDVRVLNGGLQSWADVGFEVATEEYLRMPRVDFGAVVPVHPEFAVDIPQAREILRAGDKNLVCVRSWSEFIGQVSGYNYIKKKGRIPGAVFANCGSDAYHMENYRNLDHTTREYHEIERMWAEAGISPDKHNAFYCGTGWRGSEAFFNAWLMGWPRISVFDGGWFEWSSDDKNPYETGVPKRVLMGVG